MHVEPAATRATAQLGYDRVPSAVQDFGSPPAKVVADQDHKLARAIAVGALECLGPQRRRETLDDSWRYVACALKVKPLWSRE